MGLDMTYQALPAACALLDRIVQQPQAWQDDLWSTLPWSVNRRDPRSRGVLELPEVRELLEAMPDPTVWQYRAVSRSQGKLRWLLSTPAERELGTHEEIARTLPYRVVHGDVPIGPHVVAVQGVPLRRSGAVFVGEVVDHLEAIDEAELRASFDPGEMVGRVYQAFGNDTFDELWDDLTKLLTFYRRTRDAGLAVVVQED